MKAYIRFEYSENKEHKEEYIEIPIQVALSLNSGDVVFIDTKAFSGEIQLIVVHKEYFQSEEYGEPSIDIYCKI